MDPKRRYESDDVDWLAQPDAVVEGPWIERKESFQTEEIARQISAFANGQPPGGLIVVGVRKDGTFLGINAYRSAINEKLGHLADNTGAIWEHRFIAISDGQDQLLFIFVPFSAGRVICLKDGRAFRRFGSSTRKLSPEEVEELRDARGEVSFEQEIVGS